jgi:hypothetical protein
MDTNDTNPTNPHSLSLSLAQERLHGTCPFFLHPSLVIYFLFFPNPTHKTGTANRWETTNSKTPGPIIMMARPETGSSSQVKSYLLHFSSLGGVRLCFAFLRVHKAKMLSQNHFGYPSQHLLTFLHSILM